MKNPKESQYSDLFQLKLDNGLTRLGVMNNQVWHDDPKRFLFSLSRYKFVSKILLNKKNVLEVGCGDAFASRIVLQNVQNLSVMDFDQLFLDDIKERFDSKWPLNTILHDFTTSTYPQVFDAIYSLDVLEHISKDKEDIFIKNIINSLDTNGVLVFGMPSLESQIHASYQSKIGHINCKTGPDLKVLFESYFHNVFLFSMNDELVHTGFTPMAHYIFVICTNLK